MSAGSLTLCEVDAMLQEVVASALGPTPPSKRKLPLKQEHGAEQSQEQRSPNVQTAGSDDSTCMQPGCKKPKLEQQAPFTAYASAATLLPPVPAPAPPAAPTLPTCQLAPVDLEAAVGELLGVTEELLASTQPAGEAGAAAKLQASRTDSVPVIALVPAEPSIEPTETHEQPSELQLTQPASSSGASMPATAGGLAAAPTCKLMASSAPTPAAMLPPTINHPPPAAEPTEPLLPASAAAALPASQPIMPPPTQPAASAPAAAVPIAAHASAPAASGALHDGSADRLVRRPAPTCTQPSSTQPAAAPASVVDMLKGDIDQDLSEPHSSGAPSGWTSGSDQKEGALSPSLEPSPTSWPSKPMSSPPPPRRPVSAPEQLADYVLQAGRVVGSGGLGCVYAAVHKPSGRPVALKLGGSFKPEDGPGDFTWTTFRTEWNTYARLAAGAASACTPSGAEASASGYSQLPWLVRPYEFGLWEDGTGGVAPWLTMSLLGPSLHSLNQRHRPAVRAQLGGYARGMLAALEGLHRQGIIHNDIKPANFAVPHGFAPPSPASCAEAAAKGTRTAGLQDAAVPQIFLIDFGFALKWDPSRAGTPYEFVGTPDFAASAVLAGQRPGLRDDLEALGYTLLELVLGDLPWDVTKHPQPDAQGREREVSAWTCEALVAMLARRDWAWQAAAGSGRIPAWLVDWVEYCRALHPSATPDYGRLRRLIAEGEAEAEAAAKAAARAANNKAWLGVGAEE